MDKMIENYAEATDSSHISFESVKEHNFVEKESSFEAGQYKSYKFKLKTYKPQARSLNSLDLSKRILLNRLKLQVLNLPFLKLLCQKSRLL